MTAVRSTTRYEIALLLVVLIWGVNFPAVKYVLAVVKPLTFNAIRFSISAILLGVLLSLERRKHRPKTRASLRSWLGLAGLGLLGHFAYQVLFVLGLDNTTAGNSAFLISTSPLWTAVVGGVFGNERITRKAWLGLVLGLVGATILIVGRSGLDFSDARLFGNAASLLAAIAWGSFTALSRPFLGYHSPTSLAFWSMMVALPFLWGVALPEPNAFAGVTDTSVIVVLAFSGILSTGVAYVLWNQGIRYVGAAHTAAFANLVPVVAFAVGLLWLGESVSTYEVAGAITILLGLFLMRWTRARHAPPIESTS